MVNNKSILFTYQPYALLAYMRMSAIHNPYLLFIKLGTNRIVSQVHNNHSTYLWYWTIRLKVFSIADETDFEPEQYPPFSIPATSFIDENVVVVRDLLQHFHE